MRWACNGKIEISGGWYSFSKGEPVPGFLPGEVINDAKARGFIDAGVSVTVKAPVQVVEKPKGKRGKKGRKNG